MAVLFELDKSKLDERINEAALRCAPCSTHCDSLTLISSQATVNDRGTRPA